MVITREFMIIIITQVQQRVLVIIPTKNVSIQPSTLFQQNYLWMMEMMMAVRLVFNPIQHAHDPMGLITMCIFQFNSQTL
jgi:hypothetical protein